MTTPESVSVQPAAVGRIQPSIAAVLNDIRQLVQSAAPGVFCSLLKRAGDDLELVTAPGVAPDTIRNFQSCRSDEESLHRLETHLAQQLGFESCRAAWILSAQSELLGAVALLYKDRNQETASGPELLQSASRVAAIAIERDMLARLGSGQDSITGLLQRESFIERLDILAARPEPELLALLRIDLDRFHHVNDALGGAAGDQLLAEAGGRLKRLMQPGELAARMGADEFALALVKSGPERNALRIAQDALKSLRAAYHAGGKDLFLTASIGLAFPRQGGNTWHLLRNASLAMHEVKREGGNAVKLFRPESYDRAVSRLELESALRRAIECGELDLVYEPVVSARGQLESFEALLTWRHPVLGVISPREFIPIAEETGLITRIGSWVMMEACLAGAAWRRAGLSEARISLNVSARQFEQDNFVETMAVALAISGFPPQLLELELTESCVMLDLARSAERMTQIRNLGVRIAIDDFGTGYSSLSYLHKLPVNGIKIDQSFLRGISEVDGSLPVIQGIVRLAHGMNLTVVAEGVETREEMELIRLAGCDQAQGHLFGPPLRAEEAARLLAGSVQAAAF